MTEKQVLNFKPASRLERVSGEHSERACKIASIIANDATILS
jgi:hypothetical protein